MAQPLRRVRAVPPLIGVDDQQRRICGPCAGDTREWTCRTCGRFAALFANGSCPHCVAQDRVRRLLADPTGRPRPQLAPVLRLLEAEIEADPFAILLWLHRTAWAKLLGELADTHTEITHAVLDALPRRRYVNYLRAVLVNTGILPARNEDLESTPTWLNELLAGLSPQAAQIIRPYATWSVLRRARNRARHRPPTRSVRSYIRGRILLAANFLAWLEQHDLKLGAVTQTHVDVWLEEGSSNHYRLRDFINWARARGLVGQVTIPWTGRQAPADVLDDEKRWQLLKRCLHDEQLDLPVRVAGALLLLYGQVPTKIAALTTGHITVIGANTHLTLDAQPVLVPPRLADLLTRLANGRPGGRRPLIEQPGDGERLLFPGFLPGTAIGHDRLSEVFNQQLGLRVRPARNAALCALAADLPAPVLADLLGLHITTAVRWSHLVRRDWTGYLAARKAQVTPSTGKSVSHDTYPPAKR